MSNRGKRKIASQRPLSWEELRDNTEFADATDDVPADLTDLWSNLADPGDVDIDVVRKGSGSDEPSAPYRPDWVASSLRPQAAPRLSPPRVEMRGVPLQPMVIWPPVDDRKTYNDPTYPWGCVCHIQGRQGAGSGVIVGPRHVLTASHVVDWDGPAERIEVLRAGGSAQATARTIRRVYFTKIVGDPGATTIDEDYAVLVTDQRIGDRFGWLGVRTYDSDWDDEPYWTNIGYAGDVAGGSLPFFQRNKSMDEDEWDYGGGRAMTTSADLMPRQSGSPMFGFWTEGNPPQANPYVVAVAAAVGNIVLSGTENWCSGGNDLTRLVNQARANNP